MNTGNARAVAPSSRKGFARKALLVAVAGLSVAAASSFVSMVSANDRAITNYDRQTQGQREEPWERAERNTGRQSVVGADQEDSNLPVNAELLEDSYERVSQDPGWVAMEAQVDDQTDRIDGLEDLLSQMEDASSWQEEPPEYGEWDPGTVAASAMWEPAITDQTVDFEQSRDVTKVYSREVEIWESIASTGERRLKDSYTETDSVEETQTRWIDVAISSWVNSGGRYGCTNWSPARSTVNQGQSFTQTATDCEQDQVQTISYSLRSSGDSIGSSWTKPRTLTGQSATRSSTGRGLADKREKSAKMGVTT